MGHSFWIKTLDFTDGSTLWQRRAAQRYHARRNRTNTHRESHRAHGHVGVSEIRTLRIPPDAATAKVFRWVPCSHYWRNIFYIYNKSREESDKIEGRQPLTALSLPVRYKCMTPFMLIQQGHCLSLYIRQKERKWIRGNLLFQNLLLVHPVGDARDGVLVVASVRRHCRWMGTLFFLVTNSVHMHC